MNNERNRGDQTRSILAYEYAPNFREVAVASKPNFVSERRLKEARKELYSGRRAETGYKSK